MAIDEKDILLGTTQEQNLLKIATLGASEVDLRYNADILTYESGVFKLKYNSDLESRVSLPPLSKLVSLNTIPIEITDNKYVLPPGDIALSFNIRPVTSKEFVVPLSDSEQKVEAITAAKIEEFSANADEIQFIIKDKAIVLTIIPKMVMANPNDALLNGEKVDFSQFHQNATHSWIRIDPHEKGLVRILDTNEKTEEGGGCLIATAAYGSEMSSQVQFLREIRGNQLLNTASGTAFMTGFNQLYYSFSPTIADWQRENLVFKETVKIAITPLLASLSIMEHANSEVEILGLGISVIVMNIGMYFIFPIVILYYLKRNLRTTGTNNANRIDIFSCNVRSVVKTSLFGLIALLVLTVSLSSTYFESAYADDHEEPIKMVLDLTYENILESIENADEVPEASQTFFDAGYDKYLEALTALEEGDIVTAKESALVAMALFEDAAEEIGALENQASTQIPPGLGAGIGSASDTGISNGQGLGVGGIPPGILKQVTAGNIFEIQEEITDIDEEVDELRELIESNNLDVNLEDYDESINLAKAVLANGDIPDARAKLAVALDIKDDLYDQIDEEVDNNQDERVQEFVDNSITEIEALLEKENLGLTKKAIKELETVLEVLKSGDVDDILDKTDDDSDLAKELENDGSETSDEGAEGETGDEGPSGDTDDGPGNSENAPGQNKEDGPPGQDKEDGPGNSENAPGQNKDKDEAELPPGFEAAGDNPADEAVENSNGLGVGNIPPGLAKLFGTEDEAGGNILDDLPPGLAKKFDDYTSSFEQSPDDFFENHYEADIDDIFEMNFDGTNKGNGDGKGKYGAYPGKSGEAPGKFKAATKEGGNPNCGTKGITDADASVTSLTIDSTYTIDSFTVVGNNCKDITSQLKFNVIAPNGTVFFSNSSPGGNANVYKGTQPETITLDDYGNWEIQTRAQSFRLDRVINVPGGTAPTANAGQDQTVNDYDGGAPPALTVVQLNGTLSSDLFGSNPGIAPYPTGYTWEKVSGPGNSNTPLLSDYDSPTPTFTLDVPNQRTYIFQLTVEDNDGETHTDTVTIIINNTG